MFKNAQFLTLEMIVFQRCTIELIEQFSFGMNKTSRNRYMMTFQMKISQLCQFDSAALKIFTKMSMLHRLCIDKLIQSIKNSVQLHTE